MRCRELLSSYLTTQGFYTEAENVLSGVDLESYENELALVSFMLTTGCPVKPPERNRASHNHGGCICVECGCTFIGDESHDLCAVCDDTRAQASASDEWQGEIECCDAKGFWLILSDNCPFVPGQKVTIKAPRAATGIPPTKIYTVHFGMPGTDTRRNSKAGEVERLRTYRDGYEQGKFDAKAASDTFGGDSLLWHNPAPNAAAPSMTTSKTVTVQFGNAPPGEAAILLSEAWGFMCNERIDWVDSDKGSLVDRIGNYLSMRLDAGPTHDKTKA
jgi:hypothetical protein